MPRATTPKRHPRRGAGPDLDEGEQGSAVELALDRKLRKRGYWFDVAEADRVCTFFTTYVRHSKGRWAGQLVKLELWQRRFLRRLFGWRRANGTRRYRRAYLWIPRKNGKSFLASGIALYLLTADGEPGAEIYCAAANRDQAEMVFGEAKRMVMASPELREVAEPFKNSIFVQESLSKLEAISSKPESKHGLNVHGVIIDEVHAFKTRELYDVLTTASGARTQPLELVISTAGSDTASFAGELWEYTQQVIDGVLEDPDLLAVIYAAAKDDDWKSRAAWEKANPNFGVSIDREFLESELKKVEGSPGRESTFKQLYLNLWTQSVEAWLRADSWKACGVTRARTLEAFAGRPCWGGLDLSRSKDMTAFALVFPPADPDDPRGLYDLWIRFWIPEEGLDERARRDRVQYPLWVRKGHVVATPGNVVDYDRVESDVAAISKQVDLRELGYDPWGAVRLAQRLQDHHGLTMVEMRQGFKSLSAPSKEFERLILENRIRHDGNPALAWQVSNVVVKVDEAENIKPDKKRARHRIDGVVASIMALGRASLGNQVSVYERRGLTVL